MVNRRTPEDATLLDVLIDGFEKNELIEGFHSRQLPLPDERAAAHKFSAFVEEARRWKGAPTRVLETPERRLAEWPDLEIRAAGRGLVVRARMPRFTDWWHDERTWQGEPMNAVFAWIAEDRRS